MKGVEPLPNKSGDRRFALCKVYWNFTCPIYIAGASFASLHVNLISALIVSLVCHAFTVVRAPGVMSRQRILYAGLAFDVDYEF